MSYYLLSLSFIGSVSKCMTSVNVSRLPCIEERDGVCLPMKNDNSEPEGMGSHLNKLEFLVLFFQ